MRDIPYHESIGLLMYASLGTHLDIMFTVSFLSQFMQNPGQPHLEAIKHVFHYLKGTHEHVLSIANVEPSHGATRHALASRDTAMLTGHCWSTNIQCQAMSS